jgi:hypothetical protein
MHDDTDVSRIPTIPELERQIRCFPYGERSAVPRLRKSNKKTSISTTDRDLSQDASTK